MRLFVSPLMFAAGLTGNSLCQTARGILNVVASLLGLLVAASRLVVGILQIAGGGEKKGAAACADSWEKSKSCILRLLFGLAQLAGVATLSTPLIRAAQASSERLLLRGVYSPNGPGTTRAQMLFGINSWDEEPKTSETRREEKEEPKRTTKPKRRPKAEKAKKEDDWHRLAEAYLCSSTSSEADRARKNMAYRHPIRYLAALKEARSTKRS